MTTTTTSTSKVSQLTPAKLRTWASVNRQAVLNMLAARIFAAAERQRVDAYIEPLFLAGNFKDERGAAITKSKNIYRCQDEAKCAAFFAECDAAHRVHGFAGAADCCPALIAEEQVIKAENVVLKSMKALISVEPLKLEDRAKLLGIIVDMISAK